MNKLLTYLFTTILLIVSSSTAIAKKQGNPSSKPQRDKKINLDIIEALPSPYDQSKNKKYPDLKNPITEEEKAIAKQLRKNERLNREKEIRFKEEKEKREREKTEQIISIHERNTRNPPKQPRIDNNNNDNFRLHGPIKF